MKSGEAPQLLQHPDTDSLIALAVKVREANDAYVLAVKALKAAEEAASDAHKIHHAAGIEMSKALANRVVVVDGLAYVPFSASLTGLWVTEAVSL